MFVLIGGQFVNKFGSFVLPFLTLFLTERGFRLGEVALVLGAMSVGSIFGPFVSGYLADAVGRRNTIVLSLVTSALTLLALYWCQSLAQLAAMAALHGFCSFLYGPAASALLTDLVSKEQRVLAFALLRLAINAGFAAGPAVAGLLFARSPLLIFVGDAATTLLFAMLAFAWLPHGLRTVSGRATRWSVIVQSWKEAWLSATGDPRYRQFLLGLLFLATAFAQVFNVLAVTAIDRGLSPSAYGVVMGFNGFLIMLCELPLTQWARRFPLRRVLAVGYGIVGLGCATFGLARSQALFLLAMAIFTFGEMLSLPIGSSYNSELAPEKFRGRYFGLSGAIWALSGLMGSIGIWSYGQIGSGWWAVAGISGLIASLIMIPRRSGAVA